MAEPKAAVAIVHAREPAEAVLLIRRAERETDSWSGHWSLPGGRRDPEDTDLLDTALRELYEECGIRLTRQQMETALPHAIARRGTGRYLLVAPFLFRVDGCAPTVLDPAEAAEAFWIPVSVMLDPARHALRPIPGRPGMLFPGIELSCIPLWGFTYRLLSDWLLPPPARNAGPDAARQVLEFLLAHGLALRSDFSGRTAAVNGEIPVAEVLAHFSQPENFLSGVNRLYVHPERIRIAGPEMEEYVIASYR